MLGIFWLSDMKISVREGFLEMFSKFPQNQLFSGKTPNSCAFYYHNDFLLQGESDMRKNDKAIEKNKERKKDKKIERKLNSE